MKKRFVSWMLLAVAAAAAVLLLKKEEPVVGCRIYAGDGLIYESVGARLEDIHLSLDPAAVGAQQIRVEYVGENGEQILTFPSVYLDFSGQ